jgi:hypothetical protein
MAFVALSQRLTSNQVPLVLAGPLLRHVSHDQVTVFVALRAARTVTLRVFTGAGGARTLQLQGSRPTVPLGTNLHVVAVTATAGAGAVRLVPDTAYVYDLEFDPGERLASPGVLDITATPTPLAYPGTDLPSFSLPPAQLDQVRFVHASCRKPHGESVDALPALDDMIAGSGPDASSASFARARPHQLFLTGDQIYADDVADCLLFLLMDAAPALLGWQEALPGTTPDQLKPGARSALTLAAGLTSGVPVEHYPKSHLLRFGEFAAMYLFAWSPALWPETLPDTATIGSASGARSVAVESKRLAAFGATLTAVRRALANVPSYMVFDDHEVTDDWLMNRRWVGSATGKRPRGGALASPLARRMLQNALLAYALFQAWGSTPEQFASHGAVGEPGRALLGAASRWRGATDADDAEIAIRVGMPTGPLDAAGAVLDRPAGALRWPYRVAPDGGRYEVLLLDCRTRRIYPSGADTDAAGLLSTDAIAEQISDPPDDQQLLLTIVVAQTPVLGLPYVEEAQRTSKGDDIWGRDVEAWGVNDDAYQRLLGALALRRRRVVILSGDVHYSFAARMTYWASRPYGQATVTPPLAAAIVQLNSSALRNETSYRISDPANVVYTMRLHNGGFQQPLFQNLAEDFQAAGWPDPRVSDLQVDGRVIGPLRLPPRWARRPTVAKLAELPSGVHVANQPDWRYAVSYLHGTKSGTAQELPRVETLPVAGRQRATVLASLQLAYLISLRDHAGTDIVGRNNIAEFRVQLGPNGAPTAVEQRTWWRFREDATPAPITTFLAPLDPADPPPPAPLP